MTTSSSSLAGRGDEMVILLPSQPPPDLSVKLETRKRRKIENSQIWELSAFEWAQFSDYTKRYSGPGVKFLAPPCPVYNCHGLSFASRRTAVDGAPATIKMVIEDDGYVEVKFSEVQVGDIIVYYDPKGEVDHTGFVVEIREKNPFVWSKWGKGHEAWHHYAQVPYCVDFVKFYRMKNGERHAS